MGEYCLRFEKMESIRAATAPPPSAGADNAPNAIARFYSFWQPANHESHRKVFCGGLNQSMPFQVIRQRQYLNAFYAKCEHISENWQIGIIWFWFHSRTGLCGVSPRIIGRLDRIFRRQHFIDKTKAAAAGARARGRAGHGTANRHSIFTAHAHRNVRTCTKSGSIFNLISTFRPLNQFISPPRCCLDACRSRCCSNAFEMVRRTKKKPFIFLSISVRVNHFVWLRRPIEFRMDSIFDIT